MGGSCSVSKGNVTIPTRVIKVQKKNSQFRATILNQVTRNGSMETRDNEIKEDINEKDNNPIENREGNNLEEVKTNYTLTKSAVFKYDLKAVGLGEYLMEKEFAILYGNNKKRNLKKKIATFNKIISDTQNLLGHTILDLVHDLYNQTDVCLLEYSKRKPQQYVQLFKNGGPPMKFRWSLWKNRLELDQYYHADLFEKMKHNLTSPYENDIKKDIHRTFPEEAYFSSEVFNYIGQEQLYRVLKAIAIYFPNVGYCQGMNFIVAFLLMINGGNENEAFWFFVGLARSHDFLLMGFFERNFPLLNLYHHIFYETFKQELPAMHQHFASQQIPDQLWITKWLLTLFLYSLPPIVVVRIWDFIFNENLFALVKVSVGLLKMIEKDIVNLDTLGFDALLRHIKGDKRKAQDGEFDFAIKEIDPEVLIKISKKVNLTNEKVSQYTLQYMTKEGVDNNNLYYKFYSDYHRNVRSPTFLAEFQKEIDQFLIKYELLERKDSHPKTEKKEVGSSQKLDKSRYIDEDKPLVLELE
jgi:hypothetical protein